MPVTERAELWEEGRRAESEGWRVEGLGEREMREGEKERLGDWERERGERLGEGVKERQRDGET